MSSDDVRGPQTSESDLRAALSDLADAAEQPYYDDEADHRASEAYYARVDVDQLGDLVRSTHTSPRPYKPARELYPWIDLQPDRKLRSIYTGQTWEPEELIRADFEVSQLRTREVARYRTASDADLVELQAQLEQSLPYNCEHVVPQSWFAKREPMRGDLHHLFACESRCNSFRGNTPYAEFADYPRGRESDAEAARLGVVRDDCGKSDQNGFEPAHGKGAAARAFFYFALRYPDEIDLSEMPAERWAMVLAWHEQEAVSAWERHRNAAIHERQGNRNPFIDHPEWRARC